MLGVDQAQDAHEISKAGLGLYLVSQGLKLRGDRVADGVIGNVVGCVVDYVFDHVVEADMDVPLVTWVSAPSTRSGVAEMLESEARRRASDR
jgi:hypothetical protein